MSDTGTITCREIVELVTDYLEGTMSDGLRGRFEDHLGQCEGCSNYLRQMRETIRLTGMLTEEQIPADQRDRLLTAFRDWNGAGAG